VLLDAEAGRAEQTPSPDSVDLCFQARALIAHSGTPESLARSRGFFERALELDPRNIDALVGVAVVDAAICVSFMTDDPQLLLADAEMRLTRALAAAPNNTLAHIFLGVVLRATNRPQRSIEVLERVLAIDPNSGLARALIGYTLCSMGRSEETSLKPCASARTTYSPSSGSLLRA
jgi:hypothetical protein